MVVNSLSAWLMRRARHQTLIFHRVMQDRDPMIPDEATQEWFRRLMKMLASNFEMISLTDALARVQAGELNGRTVSVTFDDGYADNYTVALPILEEFHIPATFFIASSFIGGGRMWNDSIIETFRRLTPGKYELDVQGDGPLELTDWASRRHAAETTIAAWKHLPPDERHARVLDLMQRAADLPVDLMMTREQLCALAASPVATIGGHTRTHPILASISDFQAKDEIEGGKADLEDWIQREIEVFAYPNGKLGRDYRPEHAELVKQAGFSAAVATDWGALDDSSDPYAIPRFTPWQRNLSRFSIELARCHYGLI